MMSWLSPAGTLLVAGGSSTSTMDGFGSEGKRGGRNRGVNDGAEGKEGREETEW